MHERKKFHFLHKCGDMFDKKQLDAETLFRTGNLLRTMQESGIPMFAIEGNHDQRLYEDHYSFLDYVSKQGLLTLLRPEVKDGKEHLSLWDETSRSGSVYDFSKHGEQVRIIGIGYITSSIQEEKIACITEFLTTTPFDHPTILMMHGSIGGGIPGSVSKEILEPLHEHVAYIGLGHWHRRMEIDGWIYNPGSMEHTDINRDDISKGYFLVEMSKYEKNVTFFESGKRPILSLRISLKGVQTLEEALKKITEEILVQKSAFDQSAPIMCKCTLRGVVTFNPLEISKKQVETIISEHISLLFLEFENLLTTKDMELSEHLTLASLSSEELEGEVISHLLGKNSEFREEEHLMEKIRSIKKALLTKETPEHIISLLN